MGVIHSIVIIQDYLNPKRKEGTNLGQLSGIVNYFNLTETSETDHQLPVRMKKEGIDVGFLIRDNPSKK